MLRNKKVHYFEIGLYIFIALVAFVVPIFMHSYSGDVNWDLVRMEWFRLLPFLIVFLVNNFLLVPKLLFRSKHLSYIIFCLVLLVSIALIDNTFSHSRMKHKEECLKKELSQMSGYENHPYFQKNTHLPPPQSRIKEKPFPGRFPMHHKRLFFSIGVLSIGLLVIGFNSGIKIFVRWSTESEERSEKERHYLTTELAYLKQQVSPHFFMNTLNNIHALIDIDSERAKDAIVKLSHMMRYLLYETETDKVPLSKEIEFIDSYIELMRLRYDEANLSINIQYTENTKPVYVPSLLFLPLIENAFKHGVATNIKSFVNIEFDVENDRLIFKIENTNFPKTSTEFNEASGIGLENIRKRLALIYEEDYLFRIDSDDKIFNITLSIPIA